jgi:hypothetical protein
LLRIFYEIPFSVSHCKITAYMRDTPGGALTDSEDASLSPVQNPHPTAQVVARNLHLLRAHRPRDRRHAHA